LPLGLIIKNPEATTCVVVDEILGPADQLNHLIGKEMGFPSYKINVITADMADTVIVKTLKMSLIVCHFLSKRETNAPIIGDKTAIVTKMNIVSIFFSPL